MKLPLRELTYKRRGNTKEVQRIQQMLKTTGQPRPVVVDKNNKVLFAEGHETCQAAKNLGWTEIEVYRKSCPSNTNEGNTNDSHGGR